MTVREEDNAITAEADEVEFLAIFGDVSQSFSSSITTLFTRAAFGLQSAKMCI